MYGSKVISIKELLRCLLVKVCDGSDGDGVLDGDVLCGLECGILCSA